MVITTSKIKSNDKGSSIVEPKITDEAKIAYVDSIGDDQLADLVPTKKRRGRGRPKRDNFIRRMDIIKKKSDVSGSSSKQSQPSRQPKFNTLISKASRTQNDSAADKSETKQAIEPESQKTVIKPGILIDSPLRMRREISSHASSLATAYLPPSPLSGFDFDSMPSDIQNPSSPSAGRILV